jgi:hypothetical protein
VSTADEHDCEYLAALTEILAIFDDYPAMTEDLLSIADDQHTVESRALVTIREIGRRVMEGRGSAFGETAEAHIRRAERYAARAEETADGGEWLRSVDLQAAQVHATLAQTLKAAELLPVMVKIADWIASGAPEGPAASGDDQEAGR